MRENNTSLSIYFANNHGTTIIRLSDPRKLSIVRSRLEKIRKIYGLPGTWSWCKNIHEFTGLKVYEFKFNDHTGKLESIKVDLNYRYNKRIL